MTLWRRTFPKASQGFLGWFYLRPLASCRSGAASGRFNEHNRSAASLVNKVAPRVFVLETFRSWLATGGCDFLAGHHLDRPDADNAPLLRLPQCLCARLATCCFRRVPSGAFRHTSHFLVRFKTQSSIDWEKVGLTQHHQDLFLVNDRVPGRLFRVSTRHRQVVTCSASGVSTRSLYRCRIRLPLERCTEITS